MLGVYDQPASVAGGGGGLSGSINDVLRRERQEKLAHAVAALDPDIDASEKLLDGDARELLARESGELDLLVVGSRGYGPLRAVLLGSVSSALVRSAESPLVVVPRAANGDTPTPGSSRPSAGQPASSPRSTKCRIPSWR